MRRGFTVLELLVVIAIIGILSALLIVILRGARAKATDTHIQSNVNQLRKLAEVHFHANNSSYTHFRDCWLHLDDNCKGGIQANVEAIKNDHRKATNTPATNVSGGMVVVGGGQKLCLSSRLREPNLFFCTDHTGVTKKAALGCDTTNRVCQ